MHLKSHIFIIIFVFLSINTHAQQNNSNDSTFYRPIARTQSFYKTGVYIPYDSTNYDWHKNEGKNEDGVFYGLYPDKTKVRYCNYLLFHYLYKTKILDHQLLDEHNIYLYDRNAYKLKESSTFTYNSQTQIIHALFNQSEQKIYRYDTLGNLSFIGLYRDTTLLSMDSAVYDLNGLMLSHTNFDGIYYNIHNYNYTNNNLSQYHHYRIDIRWTPAREYEFKKIQIYNIGNNIDSIFLKFPGIGNNRILIDYKNNANNTDSLFEYNFNDSTYTKLIEVVYDNEGKPKIAKQNIVRNQIIREDEYSYTQYLYDNSSFIGSTVHIYDETANSILNPAKVIYSRTSNNRILNIKLLRAPNNDTVNWQARDGDYNINIYYEAVTEHPSNIPKLDAKLLLLYPNPTTDKINIKTQDALISQVQVYDAMGRLVLSKNLAQKSNETTLNVNNLANGNYIINVTTNKGVGVKKFTKN